MKEQKKGILFENSVLLCNTRMECLFFKTSAITSKNNITWRTEKRHSIRKFCSFMYYENGMPVLWHICNYIKEHCYIKEQRKGILFENSVLLCNTTFLSDICNLHTHTFPVCICKVCGQFLRLHGICFFSGALEHTKIMLPFLETHIGWLRLVGSLKL